MGNKTAGRNYTERRPGHNNQLKRQLSLRLGCEWCGRAGADFPLAGYMRKCATGWRLEPVWLCYGCIASVPLSIRGMSDRELQQKRPKVYDMLENAIWEALDA